MSSTWKSVDHVGEARADQAVPFEPPPKGLLHEVDTGGRYSPHVVERGEKFGELTALEDIGRTENRERLWMCKCSCGGEAIRTSSALTASVRAGYKPCCWKCLTELRGGQRASRTETSREAFRKQFIDFRTLWTAPQIASLMRGVLEDLQAEFGPLDEENPPRLPLSSAPGWPWSFANSSIAKRVEERDSPWRTLRPSWPNFEENEEDPKVTKIERTRGELAAKLAHAVDKGVQEEIELTLEESAGFDARYPPNQPHIQLRPRGPDPWPILYGGLRVCRCVGCGQRMAWHPEHGPQACNAECVLRHKRWVAKVLRQHQEKERLIKLAEEREKEKSRAEREKLTAERQEKKREARRIEEARFRAEQPTHAHVVEHTPPQEPDPPPLVRYRRGLEEQEVPEAIIEVEVAATNALGEARKTSIPEEDKTRLVRLAVVVLSRVPTWPWRPIPSHTKEHVLVFWCGACSAWPAVSLAPHMLPWRHNAPPPCNKCASPGKPMFVGIATYDSEQRIVTWNGETVWKAVTDD